MRIQMLTLPAQRIGDIEEHPFILVVDQIPKGITMARHHQLQQMATGLKVETGARAVIITDEPLEVMAPAEMPAEWVAAFTEFERESNA